MKMWRKKNNFDIVLQFIVVLFMAKPHGDFFCFIPLSLGAKYEF